MHNDLVVGVDGGGSGTRVLVADESGTEIASATAGASTVRPDRVEAAATTIIAAVRDALSRVGENVKARVLCAGVAGTGRPAVRERLAQLLTDSGVAEEIIVETDAAVAMEDALHADSGILLIAGTGSIAYGKSPTGMISRCGGWGAQCGDEGSGYWIGRRALSVVTAASDGREPETSLTGAVFTALEVRDIDELIAWAATADVSQIASLAPTVFHEAQAGDLRADTLVALAAEELVLHVRTLSRLLFVDERAAVNVALAGGMLAPGSILRSKVERRLKSSVPGAIVRADEVVGARGALVMARRALSANAV